jgi:hypothetical protein
LAKKLFFSRGLGVADPDRLSIQTDRLTTADQIMPQSRRQTF